MPKGPQMTSQIFVNLPVKDLSRSKEFFTRLGYTVNPQFTDENAACLVISEHIYAMLLLEPYFTSFTKKEIPDTSTSAQAILALAADSRAEVDELVGKAIAAGGKAAGDPTDEDYMYGRGFEDLDGHLWELFWMDPSAVEG